MYQFLGPEAYRLRLKPAGFFPFFGPALKDFGKPWGLGRPVFGLRGIEATASFLGLSAGRTPSDFRSGFIFGPFVLPPFVG